MQGIKSVFRRRKNPDRVYLFEEDRRSRNFLRRLYATLGLKHRDRKYQPEKFNQVPKLSSFSTRPNISPPQSTSCNTNFIPDITDLEDLDLEIIDLDIEVPRDESLGEQEEPLPLIIGFEYPEEEMPVWFHFGYGCDPPELEFSWLRFFGFKSDHFV